MSKVLVTGAAGQVGSALVRQLLERGDTVRGTVLPDDPLVSRLEGLDVELLSGDLCDADFATQVVDGVDAVLHTANLMGSKNLFLINTTINHNVAEACSRRAGELQRLVYVSSAAIYPADTHFRACEYHPVDEKHPLQPDDPYGMCKLVGEKMLEIFARKTGLRWSAVRPTGIVSGDAVLNRWTVGWVTMIWKIGQGCPTSELYRPGAIDPWLGLENQATSPDQPCAVTGPDGQPWLYRLGDARDIAHGMICAMTSEAAIGEVFNVGGPDLVRFPEAAAVLSEITGRPVLTYQAPVSWMYDPDIAKARELIGFEPRWGLREMLEEAWQAKTQTA